MELFPLCLAFGPLAVYLILLGLINLSRRPLLVSGGREILALGLALGGFVFVGPMQLFVPEEAARIFGSVVWVLLIGFYLLSLALLILLVRPKLIIYNITLERLRPALGETALELDPDARWAGDNLLLPRLGVQLQVEEFPGMRNVSLIATGQEQRPSGWQRLQRTLRSKLRHVQVSRSPRGATLVGSGLAILALLLYKSYADPQAIAQGFFQMLRL